MLEEELSHSKHPTQFMEIEIKHPCPILSISFCFRRDGKMFPTAAVTAISNSLAQKF